MRLLIFLAFSQYGLACKYGILFQISVFMFVCSFLYLNETKQKTAKERIDLLLFIKVYRKSY